MSVNVKENGQLQNVEKRIPKAFAQFNTQQFTLNQDTKILNLHNNITTKISALDTTNIDNDLVLTADNTATSGMSWKVGGSAEFVGTQAEWDALTTQQKARYIDKVVNITDDYTPSSSTISDIQDEISDININLSAINYTAIHINANSYFTNLPSDEAWLIKNKFSTGLYFSGTFQSSIPTGADTVIGTLPSEYKPIMWVYGSMVCISTGKAYGVSITPQGYIRVANYTGETIPTSNYFVGNISFPT